MSSTHHSCRCAAGQLNQRPSLSSMRCLGVSSMHAQAPVRQASRGEGRGLNRYGRRVAFSAQAGSSSSSSSLPSGCRGTMVRHPTDRLPGQRDFLRPIRAQRPGISRRALFFFARVQGAPAQTCARLDIGERLQQRTNTALLFILELIFCNLHFT